MNATQLDEAVRDGIVRGLAVVGLAGIALIHLLDAPGRLDVRDADVLAVAPALNSRLRHWLSDDGEARRVAEERLAACLDRLERSGAHASGRVGDADPVQAIADALPTFAADEILIAAH